MQRIILIFILQAICITLLAVPARPGKRFVTLPDGTTREVIIRGDERCHWLCDLQGHEIRGSRIVSNRLMQTALVPNASLRKAPTKVGDMLLEGSFPTTGKRRLLALLVNFANTTPTYSSEQFARMLNEEGYNGVGSFRDYYLDQSLGKLDIQTVVTPWITVSQPKQFYNIDNTPNLIEEALKQIDASVDLSDFDNDHDGILDGLIVIHAGPGQEATGNSTDIWSHSSTIYGMQFDGVSVYRYTIEPEVLNGGPSTIGVFCHEFGHNLGALDYYDTNYSSEGAYGGTGPWDLMGEGAWNGSGGQGTHPAPFTAWQKWQFGWLEPEVLNESRHIEGLQACALDGQAYRMDTTTEGDYFILENLQNVSPWTSDLPGHGLIVTHVIESIVRKRMAMNNINATYPQGIYTVCADAHSDPTEGNPRSYGDLTSSATPFPGSRNHTDFTDETLPSTHSQDGRYGYIALQNIAETGTLLSFDFVQSDAPQRPTHLTSNVLMGTVHLDWDFPVDKEQPISCNVYRDTHHIGKVQPPSTTHWSFEDAECSSAGKVRYTIDAVYASGLTSAVSAVDTRIPQQIAADLNVSLRVDEEGTQMMDLSWSIPTTISRCVDDLHYELVDHSAKTFAYAHRYRADDLLPHIDRQIKSISFIPQQRSTDASYKICVWRMPATQGEAVPMTINPSALEVVAERNVTEFSPSYQRAVPFVTRPTIERGYDYLIGVVITSKSGLAEAVSDQAELQNGYGNLMSINGGSWTIDTTTKGNYILTATLTGDTQPTDDDTLILAPDATHESLFSFYWRPFDVDADLFMPLGFTVYADGRPIAETTRNIVTLPLTPAITIGVASTYKEQNLSRMITAEGIYTGVDNTIVNSDSTNSQSYDLSGRRIQPSAAHHGIILQGHRKIVR